MIPIVSSVIGIAETVIDRLIPDKAEAARVKDQILLETSRAEQQGQLAQIEVNKAQAENPNVFVSGPRPFIMWVCGFALAYQFVLSPIVQWGFLIAGSPIADPPKLDNVLWELIFGILGMSGLRTFEKLNGVATK